MTDEKFDEIVSRLVRIETRLVQLMIYVGANVHSSNQKGGLLDEIESILGEYCGDGCSLSQGDEE